MVLKTDFSALKRTKWYEWAIRLALGGAITALAGDIAKSRGPEIGGFLLAFPAIFPAAAALVAQHERQKKQEKKVNPGRRGESAAAVEAFGAVLGSVGLAAFAGVNWYLLGGANPVLVLAGASLAWMVMGAVLWAIRQYRRRILR